MALLDLPLELLDLALKAVWPDDIENASMTCRLLQSLAIPHVEKHRNLRSQYAYLDLFLRENSLVMRHRSPTALLHSISTDPRLAYYPSRINIRACLSASLPFLDSDRLPARDRSILKQHDGFRALLHASPYLSQQEVDEWHEAILHGNEGALCALLLSLLPNLQHLDLWYDLQSDMVYLKGMIDRIAKASCGPKMHVNRSKETPSIKNSTYPYALRKLTTLRLQRQRRLNGTEIGNDYDLLLHFITLPSLRSFTGGIHPKSTLCGTCAAGPQRSEYTSQVNNLNLCSTNPATPQPLLSNFRSLRSFSFTASGGRRNKDGFLIRNLLATLSQYAGHFLQELTLHLEDYNAGDAGSWDDLGSLMAFEKLTNVDIDAQYLMWDQERTAPWLPGILPPTLKTLRLGKLDQMIRGLKHAVIFEILTLTKGIQRRHRYPNLPCGAMLTAYVIKVSNQDDAAPWFNRWQNLFRTAPWFPKWQRSWERAETTQDMPQKFPDLGEDLPGTGGFLGLPDVQDAVMKRLFGPSDKVGAVWPDLVELQVESMDVRIQHLVKEICQGIRPRFGPEAMKPDMGMRMF